MINLSMSYSSCTYEIVHLRHICYTKYRESDYLRWKRVMKTYNTAFKIKLLKYISSLPGSIVLRSDINDLSSPRKVSRNLKSLVKDGELIKLGYGIYAKTEPNPYLSQNLIKGGFTTASLEALDRLGVKWEPSKFIKDYNEGRSTQVPANFSVRLKTRYRGIITDGERILKFENNINAI